MPLIIYFVVFFWHIGNSNVLNKLFSRLWLSGQRNVLALVLCLFSIFLVLVFFVSVYVLLVFFSSFAWALWLLLALWLIWWGLVTYLWPLQIYVVEGPDTVLSSSPLCLANCWSRCMNVVVPWFDSLSRLCRKMRFHFMSCRLILYLRFVVAI